jgi:hypothetical protein
VELGGFDLSRGGQKIEGKVDPREGLKEIEESQRLRSGKWK